MTFVSYAQNFEDVMLWRALHDVPRGFYIDAGAADPDNDSVTRAFYDRGWSGINIEPVAASMRRIEATRLRDTNLQVALGRTPEVATFYVVEGTGLSTLNKNALLSLDRAGYTAEPVVVNVTTLAQVCRDHVASKTDEVIHFLKVDVEGAEEAVLAGADFVRFRPWIVLVEATAPMSSVQTHLAWESGLLGAGYCFVYFDGLNRFYVAREQMSALASCFATPPNVFDDFMRVADTEWARRVAAADAQERATAVHAEARIEQAHGQVRAMSAALGEATVLALSRSRETTKLQAALRATEERQAAELGDVKGRLIVAEAWTDAMRQSTSWRLTAPLRRFAGIGRQRPLKGDRREQQKLPASAVPAIAQAEPPGPRRKDELRRAVHQFHSGSAAGDAITNAMRLTRTLLRGWGYESDIFVEHLDPMLAGDLQTLEAMPVHADYVLILRHSMGYEAFERVTALPAPKVLLYHNITPPALLTGMPVLQHFAELGREQLARLQPLVVAALADSEFNMIELRRLGFEGARACMLLFDIDEVRARVGSRSRHRQVDAFTVLFVGRVGPSKGQDELIAAYAEFQRALGAPSRLVLVGRHGGPGDTYFDTLTKRISSEGLEKQVTLTGLVSDADLHEWYSAADLYVSLSRHEGFGVPLVEAMAYGLPVLARPDGAVPYTLAGFAELIDQPRPAAIAAQMLALALDAPRRKAVAARQLASLDRFALDRQVQPLLRALAAAGAMPPEDPGASGRLAANMRFAIAGHINGSYSLASINRDLSRALESARPGKVRLLAVEGLPTDDLSGVPFAEQPDIARLVGRGSPDTGPELVISQHYPVYLPAERGDICAALFFWEETIVPADTIALLNRSFDGVLAATAFVAKVLVDSGLSIPLRVIGHVPDLAVYRNLRADRPVARPKGVFTFLNVSSGFPRKGIDVLMNAYARAFRATDPVRLVIKVFPNPHNHVAVDLARLRARARDLAEIVLVDRDLSPSDLLNLYRDAGAMVLPTRGEGFNIPAAEAMAAGVPLIVTGFGGHMDFCAPENARLLDYRFAPSESHLATPHSLWADPDEDDLVAAMREAVGDCAKATLRAWRAGEAVDRITDRAALLQRVSAAGVDLLLAKRCGSARIGWVSTWDVRCGIAEYSRHLVSAIATAHPSLEISVLCDHRTGPTLDTGSVKVLPTWELGQYTWDVPQIGLGIGIADPQVVVVQHQPGLLSWTALADLLELPTLARRAIVVTLHNTSHLADISPGDRARVSMAFGGVARVLVHTIADVNFLKELGLVQNVTLLPHGAPPLALARTPRKLDPRETPIIGCYGFFLPGKGIGVLIEAMAKLRERWPLARLRLVNADYGSPDSAGEIATCRTLTETLRVPVEWHTEFLEHARSVELLGGCDVIALPYQASKEASSAALRTALSAGAAVAVTPIKLFDEANSAVFRFGDIGPAAVAEGIERLLEDADIRRDLVAASGIWLENRSWSSVGTRLGGMLTGLTHV